MSRDRREHENARDQDGRDAAKQLRHDHIRIGNWEADPPAPAWTDAALEAMLQRGEEMHLAFRRECDRRWEQGAAARQEHEAQRAEREQFNARNTKQYWADMTTSDEREG